MKPIIFLVLLIGMTAGMIFTSPIWMSYGNPDLTIFGMVLIAVLLEMNVAHENYNMILDNGDIDNSKMLIMMIFSTGIIYAIAVFISFITVWWITVSLLSFYLTKSLLVFFMGPITVAEDTV